MKLFESKKRFAVGQYCYKNEIEDMLIAKRNVEQWGAPFFRAVPFVIGIDGWWYACTDDELYYKRVDSILNEKDNKLR